MKEWVYRTAFDHTWVIKSSRKEPILDSSGRDTGNAIVKPAVKVHFVGGLLVVNDALAKNIGVPTETLASWIEAQREFNRTVFLVRSPEKELTKEEGDALASKIKEAGKPQGPKVVQGARSTGSLG